MMKPDNVDCTMAQAHIKESWLVGDCQPAPEPESALGAHIDSCVRCRGLLEEIRRVDTSLARSFARVSDLISPPDSERFEETIRRVHEHPPEAYLLQRVSRPIRTVLWVTFFALTLLACSALAITLAKALAGH